MLWQVVLSRMSTRADQDKVMKEVMEHVVTKKIEEAFESQAKELYQKQQRELDELNRKLHDAPIDSGRGIISGALELTSQQQPADKSDLTPSVDKPSVAGADDAGPLSRTSPRDDSSLDRLEAAEQEGNYQGDARQEMSDKGDLREVVGSQSVLQIEDHSSEKPSASGNAMPMDPLLHSNSRGLSEDQEMLHGQPSPQRTDGTDQVSSFSKDKLGEIIEQTRVQHQLEQEALRREQQQQLDTMKQRMKDDMVDFCIEYEVDVSQLDRLAANLKSDVTQQSQKRLQELEAAHNKKCIDAYSAFLNEWANEHEGDAEVSVTEERNALVFLKNPRKPKEGFALT